MSPRVLFSSRSPAVAAVFLGVLLFAADPCLAGPAAQTPNLRLKVVASTSLIAEIVADLAGEGVEVVVLIPPASCPGHFDLRPADLELLSSARLLMLHDWQGARFGESLLRAAANPGLERVVLAVPGNWMVPAVQAAATGRIAEILAEALPSMAGEIRAAAGRRVAAVHRAEAREALRLAAAGAGAAPALANAMQADFVRWAGFPLVGVFGRGEEMSPVEFAQAVRAGRESAVRLVVDNLQSGSLPGRAIGRELGVPAVTLSNFPGGFPGTETWEKALARNVDLLCDALGK